MSELLTKDDRLFTIEQPTAEHAEEIIQHSKQIFSSSDQLLTTVEEYMISTESEMEWINKTNSNPNSLLLIAKLDKKIVGFLFFISHSKKKISHSGEFGVNVRPDFQGLGIGSALIHSLLKWARLNRQIEKVVLQVFATNKKAIDLYIKLGFIEEGRHKKAIKQLDGTYVDLLQMYFETP